MASNSDDDYSTKGDHHFTTNNSLDRDLTEKDFHYTRYAPVEDTKDTTLIRNLTQMETTWERMSKRQKKDSKLRKITVKKENPSYVRNKLIINEILHQLMSNHEKLLRNLGQTELDMEILPLADVDDISTWLLQFEKTATTHRWPKLEWGNRVGFYLTGVALKAYKDLAVDEREDFQIVKETILKAFGISSHIFSQRFFDERWQEGQSFTYYAQNRMKCFKNWLASSGKPVEDTIIMEIQYREWFRRKEFDLLQFVQDQEPQNWKEVSIAVEQFLKHGNERYLVKNH